MDSDKPMIRIPPCIIYLGSIPMLALGKVHEPHYYKSWKLALASKNVRLGTVAALQSSGALSRNRKRPVFLFCRSRSLGRTPPPPRRRSAPFGRSALPLLRVAGRCESAVQGDKVAFAVRFGVIFYVSSVRIALDSCSLFLADTQTRTLAPGIWACLLCRTEWA